MICRMIVAVAFGLALTGSGTGARAGDDDACRAWVERAFGSAPGGPVASFMTIAYEDVPDGVTRGRSWRGTAYALGDKTYTHGIAFNASKHIAVHLAKPAERITADVGLEMNDDTRHGATMGHGSVTFHVLAGGKELLSTPVMRLADGALPLRVDLQGAQELELRVGDGGDGRGWDQALWAEATVIFQDGEAVRLQDTPAPAAGRTHPNAADGASLL
ncbi:MAG: NPCBM/NEW2 domain-containing protein [Planctomycetota bacterium]